jgi:hypothetical protein
MIPDSLISVTSVIASSLPGAEFVYQEDKPKEHYRVVSLGEKLKKIN